MHLVQNSLAALLAATTASGKKDECARPLSRYKQWPGRGVKSSIALPDGNAFTLIDETYDANPASVRAAIYVLSQMIPTAAGRRTLVLGDMMGLGEASQALHSGLAAAIESAKIDLVYCCGPQMRYLYEALPNSIRGGYVRSSETFAALISEQIAADDIISVKGSKTMDMRSVIEALKNIDMQTQQKMAS
jgi:UDP-N-acetylmuramoyl-tripeptide--D-alanyl-D-alanine ligase